MWELIGSVPDHCLSFYFQNDVSRFKDVGGIDGGKAKLFPCQYTSYLLLSFETFDSIICYK